MPFMGGQVAFATVHGWRMVWMPGAYGKGKTLLAVGMYALYFRKRGYRLVSNLQTIWTEPDIWKVDMDADGKLKAFILVDEGGQFFKDSDDLEDMLRNPRKMDYILCFASFHPPARMAQILQVQPIWDYRSAGIPYIRYQWRAKIGQFKTQGQFGWAFFQEMFGTYSSSSPAGTPGQIRKWIIQRNTEYRKRWGYDDEDYALDRQEGRSSGGYRDENLNRVVRSIERSIVSLDEETDELEAVVTRKTGRRKFSG